MVENSLLSNIKCRAQEVFISPTFLKKYDEKIKKKQETRTIENRKCEKNQKTQKKRKSPQKIDEIKSIIANGKKSNPYSREPLESYHKIFENSDKFTNFQCFWGNSNAKIPEELMKCNEFGDFYFFF